MMVPTTGYSRQPAWEGEVMPRGAKDSGIVIGFLGTGAMEVDSAIDLIEEYINKSIKPDEPARFVFPLTTDEFSDTLAGLSLMARKSKITYEVITQSDDKGKRAHQEVANSAAKTYQVVDVWTQMEAILVDAPQAALMVLWDEKRNDELNSIAVKFFDAGIEVHDLTDGNRVLSRDDEPEAEGEGEDEEPAEEGEPETDEDEDQEEPEEEETETGEAFTRAQLEKMSHAAVKDIAVGMGLAPRKARENMITAIMERQGTVEEPVAAAVAVERGPVDDHAVLFDPEGLRAILDEFGTRFFDGLDEWLTKFRTTLEGVAFNLAPEEPMPVEESEPEQEERPRVRRLSRA